MMTRILFALPCVLLLAAGCAPQSTDSLTFKRGVQILGAGSPRSAIPLFTQVIGSIPDGPEPHAMLALAFALDFQPEQAYIQARVADGKRKKDDRPGWECVAMGIADLSRHQPQEAERHFARILRTAPATAGIRHSAAQWMVLTLLLKADTGKALELLAQESSGEARPCSSTAPLLWSVLVSGHEGNKDLAAKALKAVADNLAGAGKQTQGTKDLSACSEAELREVGARAVRENQLARARDVFAAMRTRNPTSGEAILWSALVSAAMGDWHEARRGLDAACQVGPRASQSLANHLTGVAAAFENDPRKMIGHILTGQRLSATNQGSIAKPAIATSEKVWLSDKLH